MSTFAYLKSFFSDKDVASVTPSSKYCVRHVCRPIDFSDDITIVEYGAGAGVYSDYLLKQMTSGSSLIMFETNDLLFEKLREIRDDRISLHNKSVEFVDEVIADQQMGEVDYIISGIPFSFLEEPVRADILSKSYQALRTGGQFLAYQTSGHLKEPLQQVFDGVHTEWEWRNIPPMTVYRADKLNG